MMHDCGGMPPYAVVMQAYGSKRWILTLPIDNDRTCGKNTVLVGSVSETITHCPWCGKKLSEAR